MKLRSCKSVHYNVHSIETDSFQVFKTRQFDSWLKAQQPKLRVMILARLDLVSLGHFGDHKRFDGLIELRWKNGTRIYAFQEGKDIVVVLFGGNKNGQKRDIKEAKKIKQKISAHSFSPEKS